MIVRGVDGNNDWLFGKGKNDYKTEKNAIAQSIATRLQCFLGDCFFALEEGIDWFDQLGGKNTIELKLLISTRILNTYGVTYLNEISVLRNRQRNLTIIYNVDTVYGIVNNTIDLEPEV